MTLMLEKPFFTSKFSHEGMIKHLEEHIRKTIYTFFSLKFIPRNIKWLFWIEQSSFREKYFQQEEQPEKKTRRVKKQSGHLGTYKQLF